MKFAANNKKPREAFIIAVKNLEEGRGKGCLLLEIEIFAVG
jgi:hypothetical protein